MGQGTVLHPSEFSAITPMNEPDLLSEPPQVAAPKPRKRKEELPAPYSAFLRNKAQLENNSGFEPLWMPDFLFDFQKHLLEWSVRKGRCAIFADCGLGKTPMQLAWAENAVRKTNKPGLILAPLAVSGQTVREADKFGIETKVSRDGLTHGAKIVVTNYERLHYFSPHDFAWVVCDESSILKNFDGATRAAITEFMRRIPYRLLCTATAAPNDYIELGTSSEAIGDMGYMDMLGRFFKKMDNSLHSTHGRRGGKGIAGDKFRFRGHAEHDFWRWVCSWARAVRKPSDLGFNDGDFKLPPLKVREHVIEANTRPADFLFSMPAHGLAEQRTERRGTIQERCEKAAELICAHDKAAVAWCHLNDEGDLLEKLIPDCVQVAGADSDDEKEEKLEAFSSGKVKRMISKSVLTGFGLNWQHCAHQTSFPSHSYEQLYQSVRRSWRFGQESEVILDIISSEGEANVLANYKRKAKAAEEMFSNLVSVMSNELRIEKQNLFNTREKLPSFLCP